MKILEFLLLAIFIFFKLFILSACFGFFARILKAIFIRKNKQVDKIFAYLYTTIFYIPFIFKGINFLIKSFKVFFYDVNFFQKILYYIISSISITMAILSLIKIFTMMLILFFICSKIKDDYDEEIYDNIANFLIKGNYFAISLFEILLTFSFIIGGMFIPIFAHGGLIFKIFICCIFIVCLLCGVSLIAGYIKCFRKGKKKFLIKSFFLDENNKEGFFKFNIRVAERENKIFIHYQEHMPERKMGLDFYIDKKTIGEVFYEKTDTIFSTIFFEKNKKLEENKIFKIKFLVPKENIIAFYYKDKYEIYKNKDVLLWSYIKIISQDYLFLKKLLNRYEQVELEFSCLEISKQNFFIKKYGKTTKLIRSFEEINEFFLKYFDNIKMVN